jgi:hypothetical protein
MPGHTQAPDGHPAPQTPPVSSIKIQGSFFKPNNAIDFFEVNARFFMLPARNQYLLITTDTACSGAHGEASGIG